MHCTIEAMLWLRREADGRSSGCVEKYRQIRNDRFYLYLPHVCLMVSSCSVYIVQAPQQWWLLRLFHLDSPLLGEIPFSLHFTYIY